MLRAGALHFYIHETRSVGVLPSRTTTLHGPAPACSATFGLRYTYVLYTSLYLLTAWRPCNLRLFYLQFCCLLLVTYSSVPFYSPLPAMKNYFYAAVHYRRGRTAIPLCTVYTLHTLLNSGSLYHACLPAPGSFTRTLSAPPVRRRHFAACATAGILVACLFSAGCCALYGDVHRAFAAIHCGRGRYTLLLRTTAAPTCCSTTTWFFYLPFLVRRALVLYRLILTAFPAGSLPPIPLDQFTYRYYQPALRSYRWDLRLRLVLPTTHLLPATAHTTFTGSRSFTCLLLTGSHTIVTYLGRLFSGIPFYLLPPIPVGSAGLVRYVTVKRKAAFHLVYHGFTTVVQFLPSVSSSSCHYAIGLVGFYLRRHPFTGGVPTMLRLVLYMGVFWFVTGVPHALQQLVPARRLPPPPARFPDLGYYLLTLRLRLRATVATYLLARAEKFFTFTFLLPLRALW